MQHLIENGFISSNGVDLSSRCTSILLEDGKAADVPTTAMGDTAENSAAGLIDPYIEARFRQDYSPGSVDATLFPLHGTQTSSTIVRRDAATAAGADNPQWTLNPSYVDYPNPSGAPVGENFETTVRFLGAGTAMTYIS